MTNAHHDDAVALLTSPDRFVRLMLQREVRGSLANVLSPRSPSVLDPEGYLSNRPGIVKINLLVIKNLTDFKSTGYRKVGVETVLSKISAPTTDASDAKKSNGYNNNAKGIPEESSNSQPVPAPRRTTSIQKSNEHLDSCLPRGVYTDIESQVFI